MVYCPTRPHLYFLPYIYNVITLTLLALALAYSAFGDLPGAPPSSCRRGRGAYPPKYCCCLNRAYAQYIVYA